MAPGLRPSRLVPARFAGRRLSAWGALVPVVALAAGLLFATSGRTAQGTDLRAGEVTQLSELIEQRNTVIARQNDQLADLQREVDRLTERAASRDGAVAAARSAGDAGALAAALVPVSGTGVEITLDDAPVRADGSLPADARPDDLVIHQSDVQAVVNAVWATGAEGVAVMDQRLIATSAVRCVGNTLLLQGRTYSPPFVVTAVGRRLRRPGPARRVAAGGGLPAGRGGLRAHLRGARASLGHAPRLPWAAGPGVRDSRLSRRSRRGAPAPMTAPARPVLVVDNFDSFVYNLVQYLGQLGVRCIVRRNDAVTVDELADLDVAGVLLSPGPGTPASAGVTVPMVRAAAEAGTPVLGVCLGHQAIAEAFGAVVVRAPELLHGKTSQVVHEGDGVLAGLPSPFTATRYHSLTVDPATVPAELEVTGSTPSGIVMALRHRELPIEGVQFHPESVLTEGGHQMLATWLAVCGLPPDPAVVEAAGAAVRRLSAAIA